jgi:hypothetical protein
MLGLRLQASHMQILQEDLYIEAIIHTEFQQQTVKSQTDSSIGVRYVLTWGSITHKQS